MKLPALVFMALILHSGQHSTAFPTSDCVGDLKTLRAVLALDCSGSVDDGSWKITVDFAKKFLTDLFRKVKSPQVTIEFFDDSAVIVSDVFSSDLQSLLAALDKPRCGGGTNFPSNLQSLFDSLDSDATKLLLFISDGAVDNIHLAGPLKESGVTIFTVGIGGVTVDSLESICSQPPSEFMNLMPNYGELPIIVDELINKLTTVGVRYAPSYAPTTGGAFINAYIPMGCTAGVDTVSCAFGDTEVQSIQHPGRGAKSNLFCPSPVTNQHGTVPFSIVLRKDGQKLELPALQPFEFMDATPVIAEYFDLTIEYANNHVSVEWGTTKDDPITSVDLLLQRIEYQNLRAEVDNVQAYVIARDVPVKSVPFGTKQTWEGTPVDPIPENFQGVEFLQIRQAESTIGKVPAPWPNQGVPYWTGFRDRGVTQAMKAEFHLSSHGVEQGLKSSNHDLCLAWYEQELQDLEWYKELEDTACPPTAQVSILDPEFDADQSCCDASLDPQCWLPNLDQPWFHRCDHFHEGATHCVRSLPNSAGNRQQCCYAVTTNNYGLLLGYPGGGNAEKSSSLSGHFLNDVKPDEWCCSNDSPDCPLYYKVRKSRDATGYDNSYPGAGGGDPHFITMDNFEYTFNGHGEFILVQGAGVGEISFQVQVRTEPMPSQTDGTSTTAVAGAFFCESDPTNKFTMSAYLIRGVTDPDEPSLRVMVNNEILTGDGRPKDKYFWECNGQTYTIGIAAGKSSVLFQGPVMSVSINAHLEILSYIVVVSDIFKSHIEGLLGDWNGDPSNDLKPFGSDSFLPANTSGLSEIHHEFGLTWSIKEEDTLFVYQAGESFQTINDMSYEPVMDLPDLSGNPELAESIRNLCGDNFACIFDASITGNLDVGNNSLGLHDQVDQVRPPPIFVIEDVSDPAKWGFARSPQHPKHYLGELEWTFVMHKKEDGALASFENRIGFLHFITEVQDSVQVLGTDELVQGISFNGNLQTTEVATAEARMPTYRGPGPNATVVFNPIRTSPGAPGFLLAYASEIPPDEAVFSRNKKKHEAFKSSKSGEKFMTRYRQIKGTANNRKHFKVDMRMGKEGARNYTNGLIQLESSGDCGFFMSPNHPLNYGGDELVTYELTAAENERVAIYFLRFLTEEDWDGLIIKDLGTGDEYLFTGDALQDSIFVSTTSAVEATFISDSSNSMTGFLGAFASVQMYP